jgi:hypothetical protein
VARLGEMVAVFISSSPVCVSDAQSIARYARRCNS